MTYVSEEALTEILDEVDSWYPEDIFPPVEAGASGDRYAAAGARIAVRNIRRMLAERTRASAQ